MLTKKQTAILQYYANFQIDSLVEYITNSYNAPEEIASNRYYKAGLVEGTCNAMRIAAQIEDLDESLLYEIHAHLKENFLQPLKNGTYNKAEVLERLYSVSGLQILQNLRIV